MRTTKHKLGYRLVLCLVVLMLFFSDSSDEQALGFSACYNNVIIASLLILTAFSLFQTRPV